LAVTFTTLFVVTFLVTEFVAFELMRAELIARLHRSVNDTWAAIASNYDESDRNDIINATKTYASISDPRDRIFLLLDAQDRVLAGNVSASAFPQKPNKRAYNVHLRTGGRFYVVNDLVGGGRLIVAFSFADTEELETIAGMSLAWALVVVVATALLGGYWLGQRVQERLDRIAGTMHEVSLGKLGARVLLSGKDDDIDMVSQQINAALERLAGLVESMRQVSVDIAHDLKTPLNRLRISLEEAVEEAEQGRSVSDSLRDAILEGHRLNKTFEALLRIAQLEAGARRGRFAGIDLGEMLADVEDIYADVAEDDGKSLSMRHTESAWISGDREFLMQMFVNLVENAIRHCPEGTSIQLSLRKSPKTAIVEVADNGPGIPTEERDKVFRRLYRLEKSRTTPGNGLGLSLVQVVADLHGATIELRDNKPGLSAVVTFPLLADP